MEFSADESEPGEQQVTATADEKDKVEDDTTQQEPTTKTEMYALFGGDGPVAMASRFMDQVDLQQIAWILVLVSQPLESYYYKTLEKLGKGWTDQAEFVSTRVMGQYCFTVSEILRTLQTCELHDACGFAPHGGVLPETEWPGWAMDDAMMLEKAFQFAVNLASFTWWSNIHWTLCLPEALAAVIHKDRAYRQHAFCLLQEMVEMMLAAEAAERKDALFKEVMFDLGWNRQQLPREIAALLLQSDFKDSNAMTLRKLAVRLYSGSPSTKDVLENTFSYLHRMAANHSTNAKLSDNCKFLYSIVSPYCETGGMPQILPDLKDFDTLFASATPEVEEELKWLNKHMFSMKGEMPNPEIRAQNVLKSRWRHAGPLSQQKSAAAMAYLMEDQEDGWPRLKFCYLGQDQNLLSTLYTLQLPSLIYIHVIYLLFVCFPFGLVSCKNYTESKHLCLLFGGYNSAGAFFILGRVFYHSGRKEYYLSLGHRKWASIGFPLKIASVAGKDNLIFGVRITLFESLVTK